MPSSGQFAAQSVPSYREHMAVLNEILRLRQEYLEKLKTTVLSERKAKGTFTASVADTSSHLSVQIAADWGAKISSSAYGQSLSPQAAGAHFQRITMEFVSEALRSLSSLRPGTWIVTSHTHEVQQYDQYSHLSDLKTKLRSDPSLKSMFGNEYFVRPDVVVYREPIDPLDLGAPTGGRTVARYSPLLKDAEYGGGKPTLHASISCKLTMRSDRAQNTRTEALNLIRNRKGRVPHIVVVTAEPTPGCLESLAIGTGDLDCVYHAGLHELVEAVDAVGDSRAIESLMVLVQGRRLRDISDLPLDLVV